MQRKTVDYLSKTVFILPALVFISAFVIYPFISGAIYSFTDWDGAGTANFVGLKNYKDLFTDNGFLHALKNTLFFTGVSVIIQNPLSMLLALILNSSIKGRSALRTVFYMPSVISMVVISNLWVIILTYEGIFNKLLESVGLEAYMVDWLGDYDRTPWVLIVIMAWQGIGYSALYFLAGLQGISAEIYEAAVIDGVGAFSKFWYVTFPLLMPTFTVVTFLQLSGLLKLFDMPFIMTRGGPGDVTTTISMQIYKQAFSYNTAGYATTSGIVLLLLIVVISTLQMKLTGSREVEM